MKNTKLINVDFLDTDRLGNLKKLDLSNNEIKVLRKGAFSKLRNYLKRLNLSDNLIKELVPGDFEGLEFLEQLNIRSNRFDVESIDKTVFDGLKCLKDLLIIDDEMELVNVDCLKREGLFVY